MDKTGDLPFLLHLDTLVGQKRRGAEKAVS